MSISIKSTPAFILYLHRHFVFFVLSDGRSAAHRCLLSVRRVEDEEEQEAVSLLTSSAT